MPEPITHADPEVDRRWQLCRCHVCGVADYCTPDFDYFGGDGEMLTCRRCVTNRIEAERAGAGVTRPADLNADESR